jgi:ssDNA-binding Zn-finger/Zn-ribbon topoisomerase 1
MEPLRKQYQVEPGTIFKVGKCNGCGGPAQIKFSKTGTAYYNCFNTNEATGFACAHHERFGGEVSRDMRRAYLVHKGEIKPGKVDKSLNEPETAKPAPTRKGKEKDDGYGEYFA